MNAKETLSVVSGILFVTAFFPYIRAILAGKTKPAKASWIIWESLDCITLAGMYAKDAINGQIVGAVCLRRVAGSDFIAEIRNAGLDSVG